MTATPTSGAPSTPLLVSENINVIRTVPGTERERFHGALRRHGSPRVPRPDADRRPPPARPSPLHLHPSLQPHERPHRTLDLHPPDPAIAGPLQSIASPRLNRSNDRTCSEASPTNTNSPPHDDRVCAPHGPRDRPNLVSGTHTVSHRDVSRVVTWAARRPCRRFCDA